MISKSACSRVIKVIIDCTTVFVVGIFFLLIYLLVSPFERGFYCNDDSIRYPYKKEDTIPLWAAGVYGAVSAVFIILFTELFVNRPCCIEQRYFKSKRSRCYTAMATALLIFSMGAMATMLITEIGKRTIGRLRPHFFDICKPKWDQIECYDKQTDKNGVEMLLPRFVKFAYELCANNNDHHKEIHEARLSFPSGHSSFTVFSMVFIIIFLEARVNNQRLRFIKAAIQLIAFIASWHTCMSRVSDYKHHYTDVIAGATIGASVAIFSTCIMGKILWIYGLDEHVEVKNQNVLNAAVDDAFRTNDLENE